MRNPLARHLSLAAVLLAWTACGDEKEVTGPCLDCPFLVVQGHVLGADGPLAADVSVWRLDGPYPGSDSFSARTDSTGAYRLLVPPGDYRMFSDVGGGVDTLRLRQGDLSRTIDFHFGSIRCQISTPSDYHERNLTVEMVEIDSEDGSTRSRSVESTVTEFEFGPVPPGDYQIRVGLGYLRSNVWLPGSAERDGATVVRVSPLARAEVQGVLPALGRLRGSVTGSWQELNDDRFGLTPRVMLFEVDSTRALAETLVELDGSFEIAVVPAMTGRLGVRIGDHSRWIGGDSFEDATAYELSAGRIVEGADLVESGLRVRLVLPGSANDGRIEARATLTDAAKRLLLETTDSFEPDGYLGIPNLSVGVYYLNLQPRTYGREDWAPQWFDGSRFLATATPIVIGDEGSVVDVVFHPSRGGQLPVRIRQSDGFPVDFAEMRFFEIGQPTRYFGGFQRTEEDGRILVRGLWTGIWKFAIADRED